MLVPVVPSVNTKIEVLALVAKFCEKVTATEALPVPPEGETDIQLVPVLLSVQP